MVSGVLASADLTANTDTTLLTVDSEQTATVLVSFCNRDATSDAKVWLSVGCLTDTPTNASYIEYGTLLGAGLERGNIVLSAGQKIIVKASVAEVSAVVWGMVI